MYSVSGAESTLKVGMYFNIFPIFLPISESGGVTKSRPIDPFLCDISIFKCKVWTKKCSNLPFLGAITYVLHVSFHIFELTAKKYAVNSSFFYSTSFFLHLPP